MCVAIIAPFNHFGGSEKQILLLLQELEKRDLEYVFFHFNIQSQELLEELGAIPTCKHVKVHLRSVKNVFQFFVDIQSLAKQLKQYECDLAHCWNYSGHIIGGLASMLARLPCIFSIGGLDPWKKNWQLPFYRLLNRIPDQFVFQSVTERDIVSKKEWIPVQKTEIIPNGIDYRRFNVANRNDVRIKVRKELDIPLSHSMILSVGSLRSIKGHDILIEGIRKLKVGHPDLLFHVLIVGDGPLRKEYEQSARGLPISFAGFRKDVERFYHAADLYCQPSRSEGLPNTVLEAMCCGLPIIASEVGGMAELVTADNGLLCEPENPESLASNLCKMLAQPEIWPSMAEASRRMSERFSVERMVSSYLSLYNQVLFSA